jgi:signal peptidase I
MESSDAEAKSSLLSTQSSGGDAKRRVIIAFLLALVGPWGLGQLYNGQVKKAFCFFVAVISVAAISTHFSLFYTFSGFIVAVCAGAVIYVLSVVDACWQARKLKSIRCRFYNRWYVYLGLVLVFGCIVDFTGISTTDSYKAFRISSGNMQPSLRIGERVISSLGYYKVFRPKRGEIAVFTREEDSEQIKIIGRIMGLPGEVIELKGTQLFVNGAPVEENYAVYEGDPFDRNFGPVTVPEGKLFFLGDNRDHSRDSRFLEQPFVGSEDLLAKVLYIYWSPGRMNRIGVELGT